MRTHLIASIIIILVSLDILKAQEHPADVKNVEWLCGTWLRTNDKKEQLSYERWEKTGEEALRGFGVTLSGQDTIFREKLKIISRDGSLFYVADVPENKESIFFRFTKVTDDSFVCENPEHDFPKTISYERNGTQLTATISGNGKSVTYLFRAQ
jgi:hypothetical protein